MSCQTQTKRLNPQNVYLGKDAYQKFCVTHIADVNDSLAGKYWIAHEISGAKHYFWYDDGVAADPAVPNATGHAIAYTTNDSASVICGLTVAVVNPLTWVSAVQTDEHMEVTYLAYGTAYEARDAQADADQTKFQIVTTVLGAVSVDLGSTGEISFTKEETFIDVTSQQTGDFVLNKVFKGATASLSFEVQDTSKDKLMALSRFTGTNFVPDTANGSPMNGMGTAKLGKPMSYFATQVLLRPVAKALTGVKDEDLTFHKAYVSIGELTFSGENLFVIPVTIDVMLDQTKMAQADLFSYGDASQL